jgi:hypothetical protein
VKRGTAAMLAILCGCGGDSGPEPDPSPVAHVIITASPGPVGVGSSGELAATVTDARVVPSRGAW